MLAAIVMMLVMMILVVIAVVVVTWLAPAPPAARQDRDAGDCDQARDDLGEDGVTHSQASRCNRWAARRTSCAQGCDLAGPRNERSGLRALVCARANRSAPE